MPFRFLRQINALTVSFGVHVTLVVVLIWLTVPRPRHHTQAARPIAPPEVAHSAIVPETLPRQDWAGSSKLDIPNFVFDFAKIEQRRATLFPFLSDDVFGRLHQLAAAAQRLTFVLTNGQGSERPRRAKPPLRMSAAAIERLTDQLWSRRERWPHFAPIAARLVSNDPDEGQLPLLVRTYTDRNLLQLYVDAGSADARLWTMLGLAADHADFIALIAEFAVANPSTRTTTELLFMLDELVQSSRESLLTLMSLDAEKDLWWTTYVNREGQMLIKALQQHYRMVLEQRGLISSKSVALDYDDRRFEVLSLIEAVSPGGYRASDARFLIGSIFWRQGNQDEAMRWWGRMAPQAGDKYQDSAIELIAAIGQGDPSARTNAADRVLERERRRWAEFWQTRLRQFGHSADSY